MFDKKMWGHLDHNMIQKLYFPLLSMKKVNQNFMLVLLRKPRLCSIIYFSVFFGINFPFSFLGKSHIEIF
jgi:hypothetical protein